MVRCKACGYLMPAGKHYDRCPACGAPKTAFETYNDPVGPERRRILKLDLHPVAVHFTVSFIVAVLVFSIAIPFLAGEAQIMLIDTSKILTLFIPVIIIATFWVGWLDGTIRFRKIGNSHILKTKIVYAVSLFVISLAITVVIWVSGYDGAGLSALIAVLGAAALVLVIVLALLGVSINQAAFPGK